MNFLIFFLKQPSHHGPHVKNNVVEHFPVDQHLHELRHLDNSQPNNPFHARINNLNPINNVYIYVYYYYYS